MEMDERIQKLQRTYIKIIAIFWLILMFWLWVSLTFSVGAQIVEEIERDRRIPTTPKISLESDKNAKDCYKRLQGFYMEFKKHATAINAKVKKNPQLAYEQWKEWYKVWDNSLTKLGDHYGFNGEITNPNKNYNKLKAKYKLLKSVSSKFDMQIKEIMTTINNDLKTLNNEFSP